MTVYEADWICPVSSPPVRNGRLAVEDGVISSADIHAREEGLVRFSGCAIIPGFVNAHAHLELTILRGYLDDLPFTEWIPRLTQAKYNVLSPAEIQTSARLGVVEMLRAGVTCAAEVMDLGAGWEAMREYGISGIAYQEVFGPAESQADDALAGLKQKIERYRRDETADLRAGVSPHAPYTVSPALYRAVTEYAEREQLRMTTHIAESLEEVLFVRDGAGVFADRLRQRGVAVEPRRCSPAAYIGSLGLLRPEMLLAHAVYLDPPDFERLHEAGAAVVHCPKSNAKLAQGIAPLADLVRIGIPLGLGTDSVASNNAVDMFEEMRTAIFQQRAQTQNFGALDAQTAFRMATLGGAECLGVADRLGSLDPGKRADFVVVDVNDLALQPVYDPIETMVYSASRRNVRATYVAGREVQPDAADLLAEARRIGERLAKCRRGR